MLSRMTRTGRVAFLVQNGADGGVFRLFAVSRQRLRRYSASRFSCRRLTKGRLRADDESFVLPLPHLFRRKQQIFPQFLFRDLAGDADEIGVGEVDEVFADEREVGRDLRALVPARGLNDLNDDLIPRLPIVRLRARPSMVPSYLV